MKKLALLLAATAIALLLGEGLLRLTGLGIIKPEIQFGETIGARLDAGTFIFDKDLFWREPEGAPDAFHVENHFVRVGDNIAPHDRRLRILCLGDSCVRLSQTNRPFSICLQEAMGPGAEVFNASLPGYTSHQGLVWLKKQLLALKPDVVVVYFGWNDHWRSWGLSDRDFAHSLRPGSSRLLSLLRSRPQQPPMRLTPTEYRENLVEMARLITSQGGKMVLVLAPHNFNPENTARYRDNRIVIGDDDPRDLHLEYLAEARAVGQHFGVRLYDAATQFAGVAELDRTLRLDGIHPTDPGHQILAQTLADDIRRHDLGLTQSSADPVGLGLSVLAQETSFQGDWTTAVRFFGRAIAAAPDDVRQRLGLAWLLATCPEAAVRNGAEALAVLASVQGGAAQSVQFHDVQAAGLAESGQFEAAVNELDQALAVLEKQGRSQSAFARSISDRRQLYRSGQAFHTAPPAPSGS